MHQSAPHRRTIFAGLASLGLAAPGLARAQVGILENRASRISAPIDSYAPPTSLKSILDIYRRMTGPVTLNGAGPFPFVADTGANQSVISAELAAQLGLPAGDAQELNGVAGVHTTQTVTARLALGPRGERPATLSVLPAAAIGGVGMLGLDQLDGARLTLDFQNQTLILDQRALPGFGSEVSMRAHRRDGQLTLVDADLAGIPVTAFLDSGAQDTIGNMALRQLAITRYPTTPWRPIPIVSVTGQTVDAEFADLPALRVGGLTLPDWPVAFADMHIFHLWNLVDRPAVVLGVDLMSRFEAVCLDFRKDQVQFRLPTRG
jgi:hypothetical protein